MDIAALAKAAALSDETPAVPARFIREHAPMSGRRDLSQAEKGHVTRGEHQWLPELIQTDSTQIPDMMSSPGKGALISGSLGAAAGGLAGHALGNLAGAPGKGALIGAAAGGIPLAIHSYLSRHHQNDHLQETMQRLPPEATKRDYDAVELLGDAFGRRFASDKTAAPWNRAVRVRTHKRKYPNKTKAKQRGKRGSDDAIQALCDTFHTQLKSALGQGTHEDDQSYSPSSAVKADPQEDSKYKWNMKDRLARLHERRGENADGSLKYAEARGPAGEYCPHCDARQEEGDDGYCNQCGKNRKGEKRAWTDPAILRAIVHHAKYCDISKHIDYNVGPAAIKTATDSTTLLERMHARRGSRAQDDQFWKTWRAEHGEKQSGVDAIVKKYLSTNKLIDTSAYVKTDHKAVELSIGDAEGDYDIHQIRLQKLLPGIQVTTSDEGGMPVGFRRLKSAAQRTCSCGTEMKGAWCPACRKFDWKKSAAELPPFASGFLDGCMAAGMTAGQIKAAADRLAACLDPVTASELQKAAGLAGMIGEGVEKFAPKALSWLGGKIPSVAEHLMPAAENATENAAENAAKPGLMSAIKAPFAGSGPLAGTLGKRLGVGTSAGVAAAFDPSAEGHRLQAGAAGGAAGFVAPNQVAKPLLGYTAGEGADYSGMLANSIGHGITGHDILPNQGDLHLRHILGATTALGSSPVREMIGNAFDKGVSQLPEGMQGGVSALGRGIGDFAHGAATPVTSHNPFTLGGTGKYVMGPDGKALLQDAASDMIGPRAAQAASPAYQAGRIGMQAARAPLNVPLNGVEALGRGALAGGQSLLENRPGLVSAGMGAAGAAAVGIPVAAQITHTVNQGMNQAQQLASTVPDQARDAARSGTYQAFGVDPQQTQNLSALDKLQDQISSGDPAQQQQAQQQAQSMGMGMVNGKFDPQAFSQQVSANKENTILSSHGVDPKMAQNLKQQFNTEGGMGLIKQFVGSNVGEWFNKIKTLFSAGGTAAAGAMAHVGGIADNVLRALGMNSGSMSTSQKVMVLLGGLGLLGGAVTGSPMTALAGGASLAGGLMESGGPLNGMMHSVMGDQSQPAASPVAAPATAPAVSQPSPVHGMDMLDDRGVR